MLVLYESAAGYSLFKVLDESKLSKHSKLYKQFSTPEGAQSVYVTINNSVLCAAPARQHANHVAAEIFPARSVACTCAVERESGVR